MKFRGLSTIREEAIYFMARCLKAYNPRQTGDEEIEISFGSIEVRIKPYSQFGKFEQRITKFDIKSDQIRFIFSINTRNPQRVRDKLIQSINDHITHIGEFPYKGRFADELIGYPRSDNIT